MKKALLMTVLFILFVTLSLFQVYAASGYLVDDFEDGDISKWEFNYHYQTQEVEGIFNSNTGGGPSDPIIEVVDGGANGTEKCLKFFNNLNGAWVSIEKDIDLSEVDDPSKLQMMTFFLRGEMGVKTLVIEAYEIDGTRWRATILVTNNWGEYKLTANHFVYLLGGEGRGDRNDRIRFGELYRVGFTIGGADNGIGEKIFYVDEIELK